LERAQPPRPLRRDPRPPPARSGRSGSGGADTGSSEARPTWAGLPPFSIVKGWKRSPTPPAPDGLAAALGLSPPRAALSLPRGCADADAAARFLAPHLDHLHDPFLLPDMGLACDRIARAIERGEKICVHGDYDVDGVCAAALLTRTLRVLGAQVDVC